MKTYEIKPLEWERHTKPSPGESALTPLGCLAVKSHPEGSSRWHWWGRINGKMAKGLEACEESAKLAAEAHYIDQVEKCLIEVTKGEDDEE